ncbi:PREDICTED: G-type lectin S-receptor-like serine/threonine-protein kinase CES101 isoform X2 [Tarenaya hassleriana]|uniref:G-type lectin S-receptor-like serine/threonine-protein kinase CES101 isoform X2 n=1 Tax=Tarenaya hassleriana TaxID=28532 RepID=UPI00053C5BA5|nr:PREDICTED: G-type lectin S-receptor-like serine/threonine-protein kinase CES101 isoform X2 [Tarenaya hassleriana]
MRSYGIFLSFCICTLLLGQPFSETDTLLKGQFLKDEQELVSAFRIFKLGFFSPGKSGKCTFGDLRDRVVWIANRNDPISNHSGSLIIDSLGKLKILRGAVDPVELSSTETTGNTTLKMLDSGNLQLQEMDSDGSVKRILWQSFDYPTDTLLPGMKLGFNVRTGKIWELTSWLEKDLPASGSFTFGMDPNVTNRLISLWRGNLYWASGLWFKGLFSLQGNWENRNFVFSFVSTESEESFLYSAHLYGATSFPRIMIDNQGVLQIISLHGEESHVDCSPFAKDEAKYQCYRERQYNNTYRKSTVYQFGCSGQEFPECLGLCNFFTETEAPFSSKGFQLSETGGRVSSYDCYNACVHNCSCLAYASVNADGTGCEIWGIDPTSSSSSSYSPRTIYIRFSIRAYAEDKKEGWLIALGSIVLMIPVFCLFIYLVLRNFKLKVTVIFRHMVSFLRVILIPQMVHIFFSMVHFIQRKLETRTGNLMIDQEMLLRELGIDRRRRNRRITRKNNELQIFSFESVALATDYFSDANKLGEGGFGPVYKGMLEEGQEVAIKRLSTGSGQGLAEFKNEAMLIAKLQHTNLVQLLGCCIDKGEKMLIYEYMPNKSLDYFLFDSLRRNLLDWTIRFNIMEGTIQGLLYLHKYSRLKVIHRDIKASNILLDERMNPKISDFGMARIFGAQESRAITSRVAGTFGYMSPEYVREGMFSTKSDIYSLGVLMLEMVSGRKNNSFHDTERPINLVSHSWNLWRENRVSELIDPSLGDSSSYEDPNPQVLRCVQIALLCVQENAEDRPSMMEVVSMIYSDGNALPLPREPAFYDSLRRISPEIENEPPAPESLATNRVTITEMEAR